jgi:hypothetical protein
MNKNYENEKLEELDILGEKPVGQFQETEQTNKLNEEKLKKELLNEIDEEDRNKFEKVKARDILNYSREDWKEFFDVVKGVTYNNRISKLKVRLTVE